jgi:tRNA A37 threonylcarbamoyladenosine dehydratase
MRHGRTLHRTELLLGSEGLDRLASARVILFGVGGVGSWCAEALVRSGLGHLTLVDSDLICITNVNRQLQATAGNVGQVKVHALRDRLLEIRPDADVAAIQQPWDLETRDGFDLGSFDYVLDAIDSLNNKVELLRAAHAAGVKVYSAMGASAKLDPTRIQVASVWDTDGCRLARQVRRRLRRRGFDGDFLCVFSDEPARDAQQTGPDDGCGTSTCFCPGRAVAPPSGAGGGEHLSVTREWCSTKARINGSLVHMTATFGMVLAGLVIQDVAGQTAAPVATDPEFD